MKKEKFMRCLNDDCYMAGGGKYAPYAFSGIRVGSETPFGKMSDLQIWVCALCGYEHLADIPKRRCQKRTWPYYNESAGVTFESESHEKTYCDKNGLSPINK